MADTDPCKTNYKTAECYSHLRSQIFFSSGESSFATASRNYVSSFYKRYGFEAFTFKPNDRSKPLFEIIIQRNDKGLESLKSQLINDFPKGTFINDKNIFQLMTGHDSYVSKETLIKNLNILFPADKNENLNYTNERWGLHWEDPKFLSGYIKDLEQAANDIESMQLILKDKRDENQRQELLRLIDRLRPFELIPHQVCSSNSSEELQAFKSKYALLFKSSVHDIIGCLIKNQKCDLAKKLFEDDEFISDKLPAYMNLLSGQKGSQACSELTKEVFLKVVEVGEKFDPKNQKVKRIREIELYMENHSDTYQSLCDANTIFHQDNLKSLEHTLNDVLNAQVFDLLYKIIDETDEKQQDRLIADMIGLMKFQDFQFGLQEPGSGRSIADILGMKGAFAVYDKLSAYGMGGLELLNDKNVRFGKEVIDAAIESDDLNRLKFAFSFYHDLRNDDQVVYSTLATLKKNKRSDNPEVEAYLEHFRWTVKIHYQHIY